MLKTTLAGSFAAIVLLTAGAANANSSTPASTNETSAFSFQYEGMRDVRQGPSRAHAPAGANETTAHSVPVRGIARQSIADRASGMHVMFPSSVNETGAL